ncbi:hypothetical protein C8R43DRAFT_414589, partial [Mycena crocata]
MRDAACEKDRARLKGVEAEILQLEQSLRLLRMERHCIEARLDRRYPILTLPNEIVSEIFLHSLPTYLDCRLLSPTLLTHLCHKWRQIALATPALWRAVPLRLYSNSTMQILASWLARSCSCPLSIKISRNETNLRDDVMHALLPHRLRWEYLQLYIEPELLRSIGPTPLLRKL